MILHHPGSAKEFIEEHDEDYLLAKQEAFIAIALKYFDSKLSTFVETIKEESPNIDLIDLVEELDNIGDTPVFKFPKKEEYLDSKYIQALADFLDSGKMERLGL